jgi:hypothetical protein
MLQLQRQHGNVKRHMIRGWANAGRLLWSKVSRAILPKVANTATCYNSKRKEEQEARAYEDTIISIFQDSRMPQYVYVKSGRIHMKAVLRPNYAWLAPDSRRPMIRCQCRAAGMSRTNDMVAIWSLCGLRPSLASSHATTRALRVLKPTLASRRPGENSRSAGPSLQTARISLAGGDASSGVTRLR